MTHITHLPTYPFSVHYMKMTTWRPSHFSTPAVHAIPQRPIETPQALTMPAFSFQYPTRHTIRVSIFHCAWLEDAGLPRWLYSPHSRRLEEMIYYPSTIPSVLCRSHFRAILFHCQLKLAPNPQLVRAQPTIRKHHILILPAFPFYWPQSCLPG